MNWYLEIISWNDLSVDSTSARFETYSATSSTKGATGMPRGFVVVTAEVLLETFSIHLCICFFLVREAFNLR
jgi:hypothetical protein